MRLPRLYHLAFYLFRHNTIHYTRDHFRDLWRFERISHHNEPNAPSPRHLKPLAESTTVDMGQHSD